MPNTRNSSLMSCCAVFMPISTFVGQLHPLDKCAPVQMPGFQVPIFEACCMYRILLRFLNTYQCVMSGYGSCEYGCICSTGCFVDRGVSMPTENVPVSLIIAAIASKK